MNVRGPDKDGGHWAAKIFSLVLIKSPDDDTKHGLSLSKRLIVPLKIRKNRASAIQQKIRKWPINPDRAFARAGYNRQRGLLY